VGGLQSRPCGLFNVQIVGDLAKQRRESVLVGAPCQVFDDIVIADLVKDRRSITIVDHVIQQLVAVDFIEDILSLNLNLYFVVGYFDVNVLS